MILTLVHCPSRMCTRAALGPGHRPSRTCARVARARVTIVPQVHTGTRVGTVCVYTCLADVCCCAWGGECARCVHVCSGVCPPDRDVRRKVQLTIAQAFGISASSLHLTKPTFFSRINSTRARTAHDEYWHAHVDKVTYGSFDYTSLLYLSDYLDDFGGGRFVFVEEGANRTVEPRAGRTLPRRPRAARPPHAPLPSVTAATAQRFPEPLSPGCVPPCPSAEADPIMLTALGSGTCLPRAPGAPSAAGTPRAAP